MELFFILTKGPRLETVIFTQFKLLCCSSLVAPKPNHQTYLEAMLHQWYRSPNVRCMREWRGPLPPGTTQVLHVRTEAKQPDGTTKNKYSHTA